MVGRGHSLCRRSNARVPGDPRLYARARTSLWDTTFVLAGTRLLLRTLGMEQRHAWPRLHLGDRRAGCRSLLHRAAPVCSCRPGLRRWVWLSPSSLLWIGPLFLRVVLIERRWQGVIRFAAWAAIPALVPTAFIIR